MARCKAVASGQISEARMDAFFAALSQAAEEGGFSLPAGFLYTGGNPLAVREYLRANLEGPT